MVNLYHQNKPWIQILTLEAGTVINQLQPLPPLPHHRSGHLDMSFSGHEPDPASFFLAHPLITPYLYFICQVPHISLSSYTVHLSSPFLLCFFTLFSISSHYHPSSPPVAIFYSFLSFPHLTYFFFPFAGL